MKDIKSCVGIVRDYPIKGVDYYDITTLLSDPEGLDSVTAGMRELYSNANLGGIVAVESRGFLFGSLLAHDLHIPLILARKPGKLPRKTIGQAYTLEYGKAAIEIHEKDIIPAKLSGAGLLIVDDLLATGGTVDAATQIIARGGGKVFGVFGVIGLPSAGYKEKLKALHVKTLVELN